MLPTLYLATRKSPLALAQTELARAHLGAYFANCRLEPLALVTTGDRQQAWSLAEKGVKGLFTKELEAALLSNRAQVAVHSAKDLPTAMPEGLTLAAYLPRACPQDAVVQAAQKGAQTDGTQDLAPQHIGCGSPRRIAQLRRLWPQAQFSPLRGSVHTRLGKVAQGGIDATALAAAGLARLGLLTTELLPGPARPDASGASPGICLNICADISKGSKALAQSPLLHDFCLTLLPLQACVPAAGQGAIALQCCSQKTDVLAALQAATDLPTHWAVELERSFLHHLGGGCQVAIGVYYEAPHLHVFHEQKGGYRRFTLPGLPSQTDLPTTESLRAMLEGVIALYT
jgi:hydroxymethylbilane synthase